MNNNNYDILLDDLCKMLQVPGDSNSHFEIKDDHVQCRISGKRYPIKGGMVDFIPPTTSKTAKPAKTGLIAKLNEFYNKKLEQKIATSIFVGGGLRYRFLKNKMSSWLSQQRGTLLDIGCGDQRWKKEIDPDCKYLPLDYLPVSVDSPWRVAYPQINADATELPLKNNTVDAVLNVNVLEHIKSPENFFAELTRVIKPGGHLLLAGPGDIQMTHGEPNFFYNMSRHAYYMLLEKNGMEVIDEYFPGKSWMTINYLIYMKIVRNQGYNKYSFLKIFQAFLLFLFLFISPLTNLAAAFLDFITPFDKRGYANYMVLARKKGGAL